MPLRLRLLTVLFILCSCGKDLPRLEGIDLTQWKDDKNACQGYRKSVEKIIQRDLPALKGLAEMDIISLLGRPDQNELYKRNQKFYTYFISAGPACTKADSTANKLILRFNAMGYAQLVSIENN